MSIETRYHIWIDFIPPTHEERRRDGTYLIKHFDEIEEDILGIDARVSLFWGTPASDPYVECIVDSLPIAKHIDKVIQAKLMSWGCRIIN